MYAYDFLDELIALMRKYHFRKIVSLYSDKTFIEVKDEFKDYERSIMTGFEFINDEKPLGVEQ